MVTKIYLIRHAEAEGNCAEFFQGNIDTALTEKGDRQLEYLAERFRRIPLEAVYTSPFRRAKLTAEAVNRYHGLPLIPEYGLREINGGEWEGRAWADLPRLYPEQHANWTQRMWEFCAPFGDAMADVYKRMQDIMQQIADDNAGKTIAVVSHGCALRNFLCNVEFGSIRHLADVGWADNTAVSLVEYDSAFGWRLIFKNDASHLPPQYSTLRGSKWAEYETKSEGTAS